MSELLRISGAASQPCKGVAREAELCQLDADDVRLDAATELWLLDINSDEGRTFFLLLEISADRENFALSCLKQRASQRTSPLAPMISALAK